MKSKVPTVVVTFLAIAAIATVIGWLFGPTAGGAALTVLVVAAGVFIGADWGGELATKTEEYRQRLIGKRNPQTTYYYDEDDDDSKDEPEGTENSP